MAVHSFRELAAIEQLVEDFAAGNVQLTYTNDPVPDLPSSDMPHVVLRVVAVPMDVDEQARRVAVQRGVDVEDVLAEWVTAGKE